MTDRDRMTIRRRIDRQDKARSEYFLIPFDVPEGVTRVDIRFSYPKASDCVIDLGLGTPDMGDFPSEGALAGWSGGARSQIFVATDAATPGYRPGLWPGRWQVILGFYKLPETPVEITLDIVFDRTPRAAARAQSPRLPKRAGAGWYRGDLQCHTFHSDARGAPETLHQTARREGLDFLAVTDHNTTTAHAAYFDRDDSAVPVFIPAYEFTTAAGHGNVFGAREVADFRVANSDDVRRMVARLRAQGHLFSVNHDKPDIPWTYDLPEIDCMEVWQAPWMAGNHISLARYQERLAAGLRITAIGGSDFHQPESDDSGNLATLARPCTFLWCEELSVAGVLDALRAGQSFVTEAPEGPRLTIRVGEVGHGGAVPASEAHLLICQATGAPGDMIEIWDARGRIAQQRIETPDHDTVLEVVGPVGFVRAQIVAERSRADIVAAARAHVAAGRGGRMDWEGSWDKPVIRALTSPIYIDE
ncbi:PHP domain-containing protein [Alphaproteobacteria bacterium GH1-50]|uniref:PHP domain-containing protein n=1 Tax=Kangsaoukella pontilimi TaxID=2691042 RepID=A0A7C9IQX6_9RHOB|nr:CehA/McbA family metallohydrolase [Kangsaoukella pontilimi]MXQ09810.1 PHP domain-containing protein [Kangsaoukella pontilimi]